MVLRSSSSSTEATRPRSPTSGSLSGYAPVGSPLNRPFETLHSIFRLDLHGLHRLQSFLSKFVCPDKPLFGASEYNWLLGSPVIWIRVDVSLTVQNLFPEELQHMLNSIFGENRETSKAMAHFT